METIIATVRETNITVIHINYYYYEEKIIMLRKKIIIVTSEDTISI